MQSLRPAVPEQGVGRGSGGQGAGGAGELGVVRQSGSSLRWPESQQAGADEAEMLCVLIQDQLLLGSPPQHSVERDLECLF